MTSPQQRISDARAEAAAIYAASQLRPSPLATVADRVTSAAQMSQTVVDRATARVTRLWRDVDPYDGAAVDAFTKSAAQVTVAAQQRVALIHTESQVQQLAAMGVDVKVTPTVPVDVRLASRVEVLDDIDAAPAVTVEYANSDSKRVSVTVDAEDSTTEQVFNRPARAYRYQRSIDADEATAADAAESRIIRIVDGNAILAQRMAEEQVLHAAVDLDAPIIGWRRIIHPEIVTKTGVCGLCVAAATRMYSLKELKALHDNCNCTVAAVTEDDDPGLELNEEDFAALYEAAGEASGKDSSTWAADLKKIRYRTDEHGELGLVLKPEPGEGVQHFGSDESDGFVTLYHSTSDRAAEAIVRDGFSPKYAAGTEQSYVESQGVYGFFTRKPGAQGGYGDTIVKVRVKRSAVERDPWSGHIRVKLTDLPAGGFTLYR